MLRRLALLAALAAAACSDSQCETGAANLSELCLPSSAAPDLSMVIEVRELCGRGCSGVPSCTALMRNAEVVLDVEQEICQEILTQECVDLGCIQRVIQCQLPPLKPGEYAVVAPP